MRVFLAGATGLLGARLVPLLTAERHEVCAMTRTPAKLAELEQPGVTPLLCDVYDRNAVIAAVKKFRPDLVMHQVTDLPDDVEKLGEHRTANSRARSIGTQNLIAAAMAVGYPRFIAQSISWRTDSVLAAHEETVIIAKGVVLRYGQFWGPGTWNERRPPPEQPLHVDRAATATIEFLTAASGIYEITDAGEQKLS
ncbi:MAG: NAD-dependent epimerase/dehydratase family protein [Hyphomonadaceae bacterium]